jgi:peroxiredoxin family protein
MSMDVMGIKKEELRDEVEYGGVGTYIGHPCSSYMRLI